MEHNALEEDGRATFRLGENPLADLTTAEIVFLRNGLKGSGRAGGQAGPGARLTDLPAAVDWRMNVRLVSVLLCFVSRCSLTMHRCPPGHGDWGEGPGLLRLLLGLLRHGLPGGTARPRHRRPHRPQRAEPRGLRHEGGEPGGGPSCRGTTAASAASWTTPSSTSRTSAGWTRRLPTPTPPTPAPAPTPRPAAGQTSPPGWTSPGARRR